MKFSPYKPYRSAKTQERKKNSKTKKILTALLVGLLSVTLVSIAVIVMLPIYADWQEGREPPVAPFVGDENVKGVFVDPFALYTGTTEEEQLQLITSQLVEYCNTNSINTIYLYAKTGEKVAYNDNNFSVAFDEFDPLDSISNAAAQQNIATVAVLDLYAADSILFDVEVVNARYNATDEQYNEILSESISLIAKKYPVSGFAISNLTTAESSSTEMLFAGIEEQLAGRSIGVILNEIYPINYVDFALVGADMVQQASDVLQGVNLYSFPNELNISQFDYALYNNALTVGQSGVIFGNYGETDSNDIAKLAATAATYLSEPVPTYELSTTLTLTNPASGSLRQTSQNCYIMGLSDPNQPLYMDGVEVQRLTESGSFGILVSLEMGVNTFTFTQGEIVIEAEIERYTYSSGSTTTPHDGTIKAEVGSYVQVSVPIASALYDVSSDGNISETLRQGAVFEVVDNLLTSRSGETTYAYQLLSGDWVMAYNTVPVEMDSKICNSLSVATHDRGEKIFFTGLGAPAVYDEKLGNRLVLTMYDVDLSAALASIESVVETSKHIDDITVDQQDDKTVVTIDFSSNYPVWGHYVEYVDGNLGIDLIAAPEQPQGLPLEGFVIMVDAGHGDQDTGAPGIAGGISGPSEKELNLTLANALEDRLIQLGAQVIMTRVDDSFPSLQDRLTMSVTQKPHFYISIHHNSIALTSDGNNAAGVEGYYFEEISKVFAQALNENVAGYTGRELRGDFEGYFYVTRSTGSMSVLYEYGFVINPVEYDDLYSQDGVYSAVYGTAEGFIKAVEEFYRTHSTN